MLNKTRLSIVVTLALITVACGDDTKDDLFEQRAKLFTKIASLQQAIETETDQAKKDQLKQQNKELKAQASANLNQILIQEHNKANSPLVNVTADKFTPTIKGKDIEGFNENYQQATQFEAESHGVYQLTKTANGDVALAYAGSSAPAQDKLSGAVVFFKGGDLNQPKVVNLPFQAYSITTVGDKVVAGHTRIRGFSVIDQNNKYLNTFKPDDQVIKYPIDTKLDAQSYRIRYLAPGKDDNNLIAMAFGPGTDTNVVRSWDINTGEPTAGFVVKPYLLPPETSHYALLKDDNSYIVVGNLPKENKASFIKVDIATGAISKYADIDYGSQFDYEIYNLAKISSNSFVAASYNEQGVVLFNREGNKFKPSKVAGTEKALEVVVEDNLIFATNNYRVDKKQGDTVVTTEDGKSVKQSGNLAVISADGKQIKKVEFSIPGDESAIQPNSLVAKTNGDKIEVYTSLQWGNSPAIAKVVLDKDFLTNSKASCQYQLRNLVDLNVTTMQDCQLVK